MTADTSPPVFGFSLVQWVEVDFLSVTVPGCVVQVEELQARLEESECRRLELQARLTAAGCPQQQVRPVEALVEQWCRVDTDAHLLSLLCVLKQEPPSDLAEGRVETCSTRTLTEQHADSVEEPPSTWQLAADRNRQPIRDLLPETEVASPAAGGRVSGETEQQERPGGDLTGPETHSSSRPGEHLEPADQAVLKTLSQEVELLTEQNQALNQRNQEMLNQLTEADREIEGLKAELSGRYEDPRHALAEEERPGHSGLENLERELSLRNQELLEAQSLISSLEEHLRETETLLRLNGPADSEGTTPEENGVTDKAEENPLQGFKAAEAELSELDRRLRLSEETCRQLQAENAELKEVEKRYHRAAAETEADIGRLNRELAEERMRSGGDRHASGADRIQQVLEETSMRLNALGNLLEVIDKADVGLRKEDESSAEGQLRWEEEFWSSVHHELRSSQLYLQEHVQELLSAATERMMAEKQMLLRGLAVSSETDGGTEGLKRTEGSCEMKRLQGVTQTNVALVNHLCDALQLMGDRVSALSKHRWSGWLHSAATEALYCCRLSRLRSEHQGTLEELASALICNNCGNLTQKIRALRAKLSHLEEQQARSAGRVSTRCQTEEVQPHDPETVEEETANFMDIPPLGTEGQVVQEMLNTENRDTPLQEAEPVLVLRRRVMELEEQLSAREAELKQEFDGKTSSVQRQHETEMEKLKVGGTPVRE